jgi:hypothetical protein
MSGIEQRSLNLEHGARHIQQLHAFDALRISELAPTFEGD